MSVSVSSTHVNYPDHADPYLVINGISNNPISSSTRYISKESNHNWFQISFKDYHIILESFYTITHHNRLHCVDILGSNDNSTFQLIQSINFSTPTSQSTYYPVPANITNENNTKAYKIIRLENTCPGFDNAYAIDIYRIELYGFIYGEIEYNYDICHTINDRIHKLGFFYLMTGLYVFISM